MQGPVGGGKSALISAIAAELTCTNGQICYNDAGEGLLLCPNFKNQNTMYRLFFLRFWLCSTKPMVTTWHNKRQYSMGRSV